MRNYLVFATLLLIVGTIGFVVILYNGNANLRGESEVNVDNIHNYMQAQVDLGPRIPGSAGSLAFKSWLFSVVPESWNIEIQNFTYEGVELRNYFIFHDNLDFFPEYLIGAHYDSRARATQDLDNSDQPVPGANDGASGVAAIIEMIDHVEYPLTEKVSFVLFDAEDQGGLNGWDWIVGSEYFANNLTEDEVNQLKAFVLFDMIADDEIQFPREGYSTDSLTDQIWGVAGSLGYGNIFTNNTGTPLIDDHRPFLNRGVPSVDIIDFNYPEWHTINDSMDNVDAEHAAIVVDVTLYWLDYSSNNTILAQTTPSTPTASLIFFKFYHMVMILPLLLYLNQIKNHKYRNEN